MVELVKVYRLQSILVVRPVEEFRVALEEVPNPVLAGHSAVDVERVVEVVVFRVLKGELSYISARNAHEVLFHALYVPDEIFLLVVSEDSSIVAHQWLGVVGLLVAHLAGSPLQC